MANIIKTSGKGEPRPDIETLESELGAAVNELERVRAIRVAARGDTVAPADRRRILSESEAEFQAAVAHYNNGEYKLAYARFRKAYREAVRP